MDNFISVLIPTYHSKETLTRAIESVLAQTYPYFEIIVVDDNDPRDPFRLQTERLMEKYVNNPKVKYIKHEKNMNGAAARNTAFRNSIGAYITFLDDDDFYYPKKLEMQVKYMEQHRQIMGCYCWRKARGKDVCGMYSGNLTEQILTLEFTPCVDALMIRREAFEELNGFDESYRRHQDFEFILRYFERYTLEYVPSIQLELSTNGVDNIPRGENLVKLKEQFFRQFSDKIEKICKENPAKGRLLYRNHFVPVVKDLIRDKEFKLAIYVYCNYGHNGMPGFWLQFFYSLWRAFCHRIHLKVN